MENSMNILIDDLSEVLEGTAMVPAVDEEITPSSTVLLPPSIRNKVKNLPVASLDNIIAMSSTLKSANNIQIIQSSELTLWEKADNALKSLLKTVQMYSQEEWRLAFERIGYKVGESLPSSKVINNCISEELRTIVKANSWDLAYYLGDSYIFNGEFWVKIEHERVVHFIRDISIKMGIPKYEAIGVKFGEDLYKQVIYSGLLVHKPSIKDELLLNMKNGTLMISNDVIELRNFNQKDFLTYQLDFDYNPDVINQDWLGFLDEVLPDKDTQKTLQQALGSLLLRGLKIEKVILLYGTGANGKSVIFEVLNGLLGAESISNYSLNSLTDAKGYHRSYLKDKLINYASDIDLSKVDAGVFKTLASGEPIECRLPYEKPIIMTDYAKLVFNLNDISTAKIENTTGFFRRMLFVPFSETIPENRQDKTLHKKLLKNKTGIFNWLLDGAREVIKKKEIYECQESQDFLLKFQSQPTQFEKFLLNYQVQADIKNTTQSSILYGHYKNMCDNDAVKAVSQISFSRQLEKKGFTKSESRTSAGVQWEVSISS